MLRLLALCSCIGKEDGCYYHCSNPVFLLYFAQRKHGSTRKDGKLVDAKVGYSPLTIAAFFFLLCNCLN